MSGKTNENTTHSEERKEDKHPLAKGLFAIIVGVAAAAAVMTYLKNGLEISAKQYGRLGHEILQAKCPKAVKEASEGLNEDGKITIGRHHDIEARFRECEVDKNRESLKENVDFMEKMQEETNG